MFLLNNFFESVNLKKFIKDFAKEDNWHELDLATNNLGYGWVHYSLIRIIQPQKVLCVGSRYGFIPAVCALACKHNQTGQVDFVDAGYDQSNQADQAKHWGGVGYWKKMESRSPFKKHGLIDYLNFHIMTTQEYIQANEKTQWQYIYLDGDHSYQGIKQDYTFFWPRLKTGGFISLHDIYTKGLGDLKYGVSRFWQELKKQQPQHLEVNGHCGLGIVHKC